MSGRRSWIRLMGISLTSAVALSGCNSNDSNSTAKSKTAPSIVEKVVDASPAAEKATAKPEDVKAAQTRVAEFGAGAKFVQRDGRLTEIAIQDGASLTAEDMALFGKLTDLQKLQIYNCRSLNDEWASHLLGLKQLTAVAITNSIISDATVDAIVESFPDLIELDLSSNTNMSNRVLKALVGLTKLQRLSLVQNRFNEINTRQLGKMPELRVLDLRGNMEAGDMTLEVLSQLPKLTALKHRTNVASDTGMEYLANASGLESLLIQDFKITSQSGMYLAKLKNLTQLEIFRCQGFGSEGVLALKGLELQRLTLRDLPDVNDTAMELFADMPTLKRLYLHELNSVSDEGLKNLSALQALELLDIWSISGMSDAAVDAIASLPNLKELGIRSTSITDGSIDKLMAMPKLQVLTLKDNAEVSDASLKQLSTRTWAKLDTGARASEPE
jgi:F-box and leucine-rich repeat protein 14